MSSSNNIKTKSKKRKKTSVKQIQLENAKCKKSGNLVLPTSVPDQTNPPLNINQSSSSLSSSLPSNFDALLPKQKKFESISKLNVLK